MPSIMFKIYGAPNEESMNCIECINDPVKKYFYKKDVFICILPNEFEERENIEFEKINNINFYIFIGILIISLILVTLIFIFYKFEDQNGGVERIKVNDENPNGNIMLELKSINNID